MKCFFVCFGPVTHLRPPPRNWKLVPVPLCGVGNLPLVRILLTSRWRRRPSWGESICMLPRRTNAAARVRWRCQAVYDTRNRLTASETGIQKKQCLAEISVEPLPASCHPKPLQQQAKIFLLESGFTSRFEALQIRRFSSQRVLCARALFMLFFTQSSLCCRRFGCDNAKETYSLLNPRSLPSPPQKSIFNRPPPPRLVLPPCSRCPLSCTLSLHPQLRCFSL